jgi:hypothetical protein
MPVPKGYVEAVWVGGYAAEVAGQGLVNPGETAVVPAGEAEASSNWESVTSKKKADD